MPKTSRRSRKNSRNKKSTKSSRRSNRTKKSSKKIQKRKSNFYKLAAVGALTAVGVGSAYAYKKYRDSHYKIEVMADVEGCWNKIVSFMEKSDIFTLKNGDKITKDNFKPDDYKNIKMKGNCKFVCMGDTIDNGPNNMAILKFLRHLKTEYGNRIVFILGNRDINKLRLLFELEEAKDGKFWIRSGLEKFVPGFNKVVTKDDGTTVEPIKSEIEKLTSVPQRLKYLFNNTFGIRDNFKNMKTELGSNSDEDVVKAYLNLLGPKGDLSFYLLNGNLVYYDEKTRSIYVHGSVNCTNFLLDYVKKDQIKDFYKWKDNLNKWAHKLISDTITRKITNEEEIEELLNYQEPVNTEGADNIRSVVHARPWVLSEDYKKYPLGLASPVGSPFSETCREGLSRYVDIMVISHSPVGQIPIIIKDNPRTKNDKLLTIVACDTTQAGRIGNITISSNKVSIKANYESGLPEIDTACYEKDPKKMFYEYEYSTDDPLVGTVTSDNRLVLLKDPNGSSYLTVQWGNDRFHKPTYEFKSI